MKIKRFIGPDSRVAMRQVKEVFGEDALILSNRQVPDGVEIIAADGSDEMLFGQADQAVVDASAVETASPPPAVTAEPPPEPARGETTVSESAPAKPVTAEPSELPDAFARPYTGIGAPDSTDQAISEQEPPTLTNPVAQGADEPSPPYNKPEKSGGFAAAVARAKSSLKARSDTAVEKAEPAVAPAKGRAEEFTSSEQHEIHIMREELARLRGMMENQFSSMHMGLWAQNSPARATVLTRMTELGLSEQLAARLVASLKNIDSVAPQVATRDALRVLARQIRVTGDKITKQGGVCVFIGPPGAGKTTSIAKMALQFSRQRDTRDIVMVSTDTSRIGAHEQLSAYGRLLSIPVIRATDDSQVREIITAVQDKALVLVDTAGLTQKHLRHQEELPTLALDVPNLQHYLVLPATAQYQTLDRIVSALPRDQITGGIVTKVDEAANLGEILSAAINNRFPLSYWTEAQKITSALHVASQRQWVEKAVSLLKAQAGMDMFRHAESPSVSAQSNYFQQS